MGTGGQAHTGTGNHRSTRPQEKPTLPHLNLGLLASRINRHETNLFWSLKLSSLWCFAMAALAHRCTDARGLSSLVPLQLLGTSSRRIPDRSQETTDNLNMVSESTPVICRSNPLGHKTHSYPRENLFHQGEVAALSVYFATARLPNCSPEDSACNSLGVWMWLERY